MAKVMEIVIESFLDANHRGKRMNRQRLARELLQAAREIVSEEKRITKNTAKSVLKKLGLLDKAEVGSRDVEFWPESFSDDFHDGYDMAESAANAFAKAMGGLSTWTNGSYFRVRYKGEFIDMGDFNMPSSRWHY